MMNAGQDTACKLPYTFDQLLTIESRSVSGLASHGAAQEPGLRFVEMSGHTKEIGIPDEDPKLAGRASMPRQCKKIHYLVGTARRAMGDWRF